MKIGLFFGSFNPIHHGHLSIARAFQNQAHLDQLWWIVSPQNPHKSFIELAPFSHRLEMIKIALSHQPDQIISDVEETMPKPSYTIDTLTFLENQFPQNHWVLLMGSDSWNRLPTWKKGDVIEDKYSIFVYPRVEELEMRKGKCHLLEGTFHDISSTLIRNEIQNQKKTTYLDTKVLQYIQDHQLY